MPHGHATDRAADRATRVLLALLVAVALLRAVTLAAYPLLDSTEGRYAEIAREMLGTGDWITPRLGPERPFWGKPPLSFWLTALSYRLFGVGELGARAPAYLLAAATVWLAYRLAASLGGRFLGIAAALILATTGLFHVLAGSVLTDPSLAASLTLSMTGFALALRAPNARARRWWGHAFFAGIGLGVLAKGLVAPAIVAVALGPWCLRRERAKRVWSSLPWISGPLLALAIAVPWHVLAELRTPGFLDYYLVGEHWRRFLVAGWNGDLYGNAHQQPRGTIWPLALLAALPWLPIALAAGACGRSRTGRILAGWDPCWTTYLLAWFLAPLVLFTPARNILITYVLPGLPALAILTAGVLQSAVGRSLARSGALRRGLLGATLFVPVCFGVTAFAILPRVAERRSQRELVRRFSALDTDGRARLVYLDAMPHSGDFYASGRAVELAEDPPSAILAQLHDGAADYFAVKRSHLARLPAEFVSETDDVGRFGRYLLRRERIRPGG